MTPAVPGKVLIVLPDDSWPVSGNFVTATRIQNGVEPLGFKVDVIPLSGLDQALAEGGVAVLHAFHARITGPFVQRAAREANLPYVVTFSGTDVHVELPEDRGRAIIAQVVEEASGLVAFYPAALRAVAGAFPDALGKIHVAWPGVSRTEGRSLRRDLDLQPDDVVFTLPAPLRASKRPFYAVPLLEEIWREDPRLRFLLAGPVVDEGYGETARRVLEGKRWGRWLGCIPPTEMGSLYATSDVIVNTAETESVSNAVLEGMAAGLPPLVSDNPGNREALGVRGRGRVSEEPAGILFSSEWSFLEGARRLVSDPSLRRSLGEAAQRRVGRAFDGAREASQHAQLWRQALELHAQRAPATQ